MFYFIHVQGQNALTTLVHLADDMVPPFGRLYLKPLQDQSAYYNSHQNIIHLTRFLVFVQYYRNSYIMIVPLILNNQFSLNMGEIMMRPKNLKGGIGSLFDFCVNVMGRRPYSDLAQLFGVICANYCYSMIHCAITNMRVWFESTRERHLTLSKIIQQA